MKGSAMKKTSVAVANGVTRSPPGRADVVIPHLRCHQSMLALLSHIKDLPVEHL